MLDQRQKFNKKNRDHLLKLALLTLAISLNLRLWPTENTNCAYEATWFNKIFLLGVVVPEAVLRIAFLGFWKTTLYLNHRVMLLDVTMPCLYATWFLLTMVYYNDFTPACYEPYPSYSLFVFCVQMVLILP